MSDEFKHNDEQLKKWLKQVHQDVEIPDGMESWLEDKAYLDKKKRRKRWMKRLQMDALVACMSLLISFFMTTDLSKAYSQFQGFVKKVQENIVEIFFDDPEPHIEESAEAKTSPPPLAVVTTPTEGLQPEDTSLEKRGKRSPSIFSRSRLHTRRIRA
ncbi:hypothetical protein GCM10010965_26550 [Caldalkalibacillus thermarum]|uniref:hypothetical protein n=1 Tax=Caldalkalibacillus thermarum TaxID=296745 RepID=UPI0016631A4A|nr:hypothetical protein [Caldalkalibacillus thermarum]GGK32338.1 hypothetical protein GCM10010965_26550 [Caldalkalibacillus thermarum]